MCCLKYEQDAYEDAVKRCPKQDSFVECPDGVGNIISVNLLKEQVKVKIDDSTEQPKNYRTQEIRVVRSGKGKRPEDYVAPPLSELEKLRYVDEEEPKVRKFGEMDDLSARLAQYLGEPEEQSREEEKKSSGRRRHRGGRGKGKIGGEKPEQPQQAAVEKPQPKPQQAKPKQQAKPAPAKGQQPKAQGEKPQQPKEKPAQQPKQAAAGNEQASGEKKASSNRRHRPRHRKPKPQGGGEQA
jgi:hypothetical protein